LQQFSKFLNNNKITILPDFIANQIAAGEVVQRPESAVKELVENALDAGADSILVRVKDAGKQLIHIVDNGAGMSKDDLSLSVTRHATSKIISIEDLEYIKSFGFRGEALASIAAVSNLEIRTRTSDAEHGWKLTVEPMKEPNIQPVQMDEGTQVFVRNLFYNVPARRKFLKSNLTEFRYIADTMLKFGLSAIHSRLTFYDDEKLIFDVKKGTLLERINTLMGENTAKSVIKLDYATNDIKIWGYAGKPQLAKKSRSNQYLFLNGRSIISKSLNHAVFSAFEHLLEKSAHPFFVINIEINTDKYDVNVHPQKHEVKFEDERVIYSAIRRTVSNALNDNNMTPSINLDTTGTSGMPRFALSDTGDNNPAIINKETGEIIESKVRAESFGNKATNRFSPSDFNPPPKPADVDKVLTAFDTVFGKTEEISVEPEQTTVFENKPVIDSDKFFWQLHSKYIFAQTADGCIVIDQHAAHERIIYEKALAMMNNHFARTQEVLFPIDVSLTPSEMSYAKELKTELTELGYIFELIEPNKAIITGVPIDVAGHDETKSFKEIIELFEEYQKIRSTNKRDNLAASFACKAAIKTGKILSQDEMLNLFNDLMKCNVPYACPHGRPVILNFKLTDFDKKFGRLL
jgi:DNA mismatch repair protein MutL